MKFSTSRKTLLGSALSIFCVAKITVADSLVTDWNAATLQAIRITKPGPPMVSRMLAIVQTCEYDAWVAYDANAIGTRLGTTLKRPSNERTEANKEKAISYAAYRAIVDLFPTQKPMADSLMVSMGFDPNDTTTDTSTPTGIGNVAAAAVLEFRHHDGANQLGDLHAGAYSDYTGYTPVNTPDQINDPNRWQPLRVSDGHGGFIIQKFVAPFWSQVIPFAMPTGSAFRPEPPIRYPNGRYIAQAEALIHLSETLDDRTKTIAEYWADGPNSELPPGHWNLFAQFVSKRDHLSIDDDVKLFFSLDNAMFDASIAVWECKRVYDSERPITAIRYLKKGKKIRAWAGPFQGVKVINGEDWNPYQAATVVTPGFAEYCSGHSAFSAAGAEVLKQFTSSDIFNYSVTIPAGSSKVEPGAVPARDLTLGWTTFSEAADQAGMSRRYGGIHFEQGDLNSRILGRQIGNACFAHAQRYWTGGQ
ncbi:MAG: motif putative anchor domain protein [Verrucomicrobiales bacterium]|nr:motif putative anchor domain protein [Verrucomicrobiales bacterium]